MYHGPQKSRFEERVFHVDREQALIAFCQEAVRIPSPSGQEKGVAELMKRKMEEYGFDEVQIDR